MARIAGGCIKSNKTDAGHGGVLEVRKRMQEDLGAQDVKLGAEQMDRLNDASA